MVSQFSHLWVRCGSEARRRRASRGMVMEFGLLSLHGKRVANLDSALAINPQEICRHSISARIPAM